MQRLKKRSCCFLLVCLMIFTQIPFTANAAIYPDTANHWACSYIDFVTNKFIMTSPDGTYFYPSEPLTRIDAVKAAAKLVGVTVNSTNASDYLDIQGHPEYAGYVNWADDIGIIDEYSRDIFGPEFEIDRKPSAPCFTDFTMPTIIRCYIYGATMPIFKISPASVPGRPRQSSACTVRRLLTAVPTANLIRNAISHAQKLAWL